MPHEPSDVVAEDVDRLVRRTADLWSDLRCARLFVSGGTGFFGSWIVETLLAADAAYALGLEITVLSRAPSRFADRFPHITARPRLRMVAGDVRDFPFPSGSFTHVIHAATESATRLDRDDPATMIDVCREGTRRMLDLAERSGATRFLLTSSGAVYARPQDASHRYVEPMSTTPGSDEPTGAYATGKRAAEAMCLDAAARGAGVTIARCFAFVGPRLPLDTHFAIGNFIRDAVAGGPIVVQGDGTAVRSYLYAADLVEWLTTILLRGRPGRAYNVGAEEGISVADVAARVAAAAVDLFPERAAPMILIRGLAAPGTAAERYLPDCSRARHELGLRSTTSLGDAIRRTMLTACDGVRRSGRDLQTGPDGFRTTDVPDR